MTDYQKMRITRMRKQGIGYTIIAKELRLSLGSIKAFCRRNDLQSSDLLSSIQDESIVETSSENDLISSGNRGNSTTAKQQRTFAHTDASSDHPVCEVTVSYSDEPDPGVIADVLELITHANYGR